MELVELKPIYDKTSYWRDVLDSIRQYFWETLYKPLVEIFQEGAGIRFNSKAALKRALARGSVNYVDGYFSGVFNASISKDLRSLGAEWNRQRKAFKLGWGDIPLDIRTSISVGVLKTDETMRKFYKKLEDMSEKVDDAKFTVNLNKTFKDMDIQFLKSAGNVLAVNPDISPAMKKAMQTEYEEDMSTYITGWKKEEIVKLRKRVEQAVFDGFRADKIKDTLQSQFGQASRKAKFLARQETSLLVSKYRQLRYEEVGVQRYKWSTSHDPRVRQDHKDLNGRIFRFDDPPVVDRATGKKANPGEDFNCRCVAIPILVESTV